jgi:N-succinyldiaminopimelate aminotransferase
VYGKLAARAGASGHPTFALNVGDTFREPPTLARVETLPFTPRLYNYAPVQGEHALRAAFSQRLHAVHGIEVAPDALQVTSGATGGLAVVVQTLLDPGDELIVLAPFWPLGRGLAEARGARAVEVPFYTRLDEPGFDVEAEIEKHVTARTVALYVNSPNNPTGVALDRSHIDAIARVVARHGLWVFSDEAYEELCYGERPPRVFMHPAIRERAIVLHTLSKGFAIASARLGFVHGPEPAMARIRGMQTYLTYCSPRPMQLAAARMLEDPGTDVWLREARRDYAEAGGRFAEVLGIEAPRGGSFLFFDTTPYLREGETSTEWLERCADRGLLLTPGGVSGKDYTAYARLCFTVVQIERLDEATAALRAVIER